ncbi:hypothetical protein [Paraburkholderia graminis]|uniref:Transmembrane protein n=1 Tax=Paraburkholderia graminis TaxID=60548 RepID=A0ABD5CSF1_9BURK|nr:hypothetical protein [Paraburkholderia graminis]MDR6208165.1 hypothetical protein [Paraburkholderia graminis]
MNSFMLGVATVHALPVPFALMLFAVLSAAFNVFLGRHRVVSGVAFVLLLIALCTVNLVVGGAGLLLSLIAQGMNMLKHGGAEPAAPASD